MQNMSRTAPHRVPVCNRGPDGGRIKEEATPDMQNYPETWAYFRFRSRDEEINDEAHPDWAGDKDIEGGVYATQKIGNWDGGRLRSRILCDAIFLFRKVSWTWDRGIAVVRGHNGRPD